MWWLDPGKDILQVLFNRILAPYVVNLDLNQVNYGIGQGQLTLRSLKLKKGALDKFQLPIDVLEGHLGKFQLSLHWMNLGNQPAEILIEDIYLLVVPSPQTSTNPEEDEQRVQAAKHERLENAELLHMRGQAELQPDSTQSQGLIQSLITKIINNIQVTVKNVHIRYEDKIGVPEHPFAAGITLAGFTAVSVNSSWEPAFIESTAGAIHKLAKLQSFSLYFDTDSPSIAGLPTAESIKKFSSLISDNIEGGDHHQYILKPVSGEGRITINHKVDHQTPRFDTQLIFEEIGVTLDDDQYRDVISLIDMYHVSLRKRQYGKYRPSDSDFAVNAARARLRYASSAIFEGVRERNRKWTWQYFAERRDDRKAYIDLFQRQLISPLVGPDIQKFEELERKLSYEDIRFYRSIARSSLKKDVVLRKHLEEESKRAQSAKQGWGSWLWGSPSTPLTEEDPVFRGTMTEEQRRQLYEVLDYDEKAALVDALDAPRDSIKLRVSAKLNKGSLSLKSDPHGKDTEVTSVVFGVFHASFIQRPTNFETSISLDSFTVFDGSTKDTLYSQIVHVKSERSTAGEHPFADGNSEPFFFVKFENNPLDEKADNALTVRMRHLEIIYHRGYVEAVYKFFKPPASQLESVEALLNVASRTLEGLQRETRAGLEYALQTHKTVDIHMDLNAPIIIIPEDVTTYRCKHFIIDAGHIAIESDLASKEAIHTIHQKRNQKYTEKDYKQLESLMYDKLSLRLQDAQFIVGDNLEACQEALTSKTTDTVHLMERLSINLQVQRSIVPTAINLAQFKVSGTLPSLQINLSDVKYKALMRIIDVAIPKFDDDVPSQPVAHQSKQLSTNFELPPLFGPPEQEYNFDDENDRNEVGSPNEADHFFDATDGSLQQPPELRQHVIELDFKVDNLRVVISKAAKDGSDKSVGVLCLEGFFLAFASSRYVIKVDIYLSSISMDVVQANDTDIQFVSTPVHGTSRENDLLRIAYTRVQKESSDFVTVHEGIDQNVDIKMSTLVFRAAPEPVLLLYDFIMSTFVSSDKVTNSVALEEPHANQPQTISEGEIRVLIKLEGVRVSLINEMHLLATLSLSTADVAVLVRPKTLRVSSRLGSLELVNENASSTVIGEFNRLMTIDGQNFADFLYQTYHPDEDNYHGIKSSIYLSTASIKFHFLEGPLHDLYSFLLKLARLKGLYDAATVAAVQKASEIERMHFEVSVKTPIIIFPFDPTSSSDSFILRLGEMGAKNEYKGTANRISAGLHGIQLISRHERDEGCCTLKVIDDIDVSADVIQTSNIDRQMDVEPPDMQVAIKISDVKLHLTQVQYCHLIKLANKISRIFEEQSVELGSVSGSTRSTATTASSTTKAGKEPPNVDLEPELRVTSQRSWASLDLVVSIMVVKLHLYDTLAYSEQELTDRGIARFALNDSALRFKLLSDGSGEAQVVLKSFTVSNTRPGQNLFREIIPAAQHDRNQFMLLYTMAVGPNSPSLAVLTVDSPRIIFAVDPVIALLEFFSSAFDVSDDNQAAVVPSPAQTSMPPTHQNRASLEYRIDLHDVSISILENAADADSQAIRLHIAQISVSQQGILALTTSRLGMSLMRMCRASESVRFLDDVDLTFTLDSRTTSFQQMTSIEIMTKLIVLRASYSDIILITSITNKALQRYGESQRIRKEQNEKRTAGKSNSQKVEGTMVASSKIPLESIGKARVIMAREQLKGTLDGFRLILIGELHEQPMLHLKIKPFIIQAKDWSGELHATTTMVTSITYWNMGNSNWEPLIDPWALTFDVAKTDSSEGLHVILSARERLDLNITNTFVELALTTTRTWSQENMIANVDKARGTYAPYRIRNETGSDILVWSETDGTANSRDVDPTKIVNEQLIDWRFDDWKTMRENVSSDQHNIGIQFVEKPWEPLRAIPVDREGEFVYTLRPRSDKFPRRLLCEITVVDNTKIITIRSTYKIENLTLYPLELMLVNDAGQPIHPLHKIIPGNDFSVPIEAVTKSRIVIQPDQGFGYKWCSPVRWEDLISKKGFIMKCLHSDPKEAAFRFQAWVQTDSGEIARKYPRINLKLRAPLELENLLPYDVEYRIYDKNTDQNWKSYLRKGGVMPIHSVELGHFILLNVTMQDTAFKPSDFAIINTDGHSDFDIEKRLTLRDRLDRKLDLKLNYIRHPDSGGAFKVQIYSPYVVVNKTGLPILVKSVRSTRAGSHEAAGETNPDILSTSIPFLLSHSQKQGHEFTFRINDSTWSKSISFEAPAAETELVVMSQKQKTDIIHVGLSWTEGLGKYKLSKVITVTPRFFIINQLSETITFREHGVSPPEPCAVGPDQRSAFLALRSRDEKLLTIAYPGLNAQWSPPINIEDIGIVHFRLRHPDSKKTLELVKADIQIDGASIFITYGPVTDGWPFMIENSSDFPIKFCQQDAGRDHIPRDEPLLYTIQPRTSTPYAWDYPAAKDKKIQLIINSSKRVVDIMEIGDLVPFKFPAQPKSRTVSLDVRADGQRQILRITNYNPERSLYKLRQRNSLLSATTRHDTASSHIEAFEAVPEDVSPNFSVRVDLAGVGVSLINKRMVEVIYLVMDSIKFEYTDSIVAQSINLSCNALQIDNQLHEALYPVILQPTPMSKEAVAVGVPPTVQASVIWLKDREHGVLFIKYCSILLQALTIEADEDLLFAVYDMTKIKGVSWEEGTADVLIQYPNDIPEPDDVTGEHLYFEVLELQPIKLSLSFMRTERINSEEKLSIRNPLAVVVNALTMAVGNINDAPLELNALAIKDMRLTLPELQSRITYHYRQDVLRQLYKILGSADFIGNPVGLFTNVSSGVADIFYEPFQGVVMHGNKELGIGIAKGAASFVKKTVFGVSDSVTKFTSSVGKGLSAATFDSEFQARRRMTQRRNKPRHAIYGVATGGEALVSSVTSAMEGVFLKPIEGAESEGALGFFKGVGKGLVGAVTKPVVGVFDLASNVSEGIRNTTTVFDNPERDRTRLPRLIPHDGVLRSYSSREALGQSWMKDLNNGAYRNEYYVAHINTPGADNILLLTASRILSFWSKKLQLEWELPFTQIQGVTVEDTGIRFAHKAGKEHDKFAFIPDKTSQSWFFNQVASVVKTYNARRRMDT